MRKGVTNVGASIRDRLLNLAKRKNQPFDLLLTRFVLERLLYRLSTSSHRESFALKGAVLMTTWFENPFRPTRDLDLLGFGDPAPQAIAEIFREVCAIQNDDGIVFDTEALTIDHVRDDLDYGGLRIKTSASVSGARVRVLIDIGFGDAIEPGLEESELPVLLDLPAPRLRTYARETVIAEKFQAMVMLGRANSRMKDLYDIWMLSRAYRFAGDGLPRAIAATFSRRKTPIPVEPPDALTRSFAQDPSKRQQWASFTENIGFSSIALDVVLEDLAAFLMPHAAAAHAIGAP